MTGIHLVSMQRLLSRRKFQFFLRGPPITLKHCIRFRYSNGNKEPWSQGLDTLHISAMWEGQCSPALTGSLQKMEDCLDSWWIQWKSPSEDSPRLKIAGAMYIVIRSAWKDWRRSANMRCVLPFLYFRKNTTLIYSENAFFQVTTQYITHSRRPHGHIQSAKQFM